MGLKAVFEPLQIGPVWVDNRIVRTAHGTGFGHTIGDDLIAYHEARARGGTGLTILEPAGVHPSSSVLLHAFDDSIVAGQHKLMEVVRPLGMRVFQQLWHAGNLYPTIVGAPPWGVSTVPGPAMGLVPIAMDDAQIQELIAAFAAAAVRCREGGVDGVEIHAAHGFIFHQFLSPATNTRNDRWGGPFENRARMLLETMRAVRAAVSHDFPLGVRVSASQARGAVTEEDLIRLIQQLEAEGLIDYLNASWGDYYRMATMNATMETPAGHELVSSGRLTAAARVPRIVAGRFRTLQEAEEIIRSGAADMVGMVRAQIADPDLVRKTREGRAQEVRPCIACNQGCIGGFARIGRLGCLVNPALGFERLLSEDLLPKAVRPKRVLVIGGGPAGMEVARLAAMAGHRAVLAEASSDLGGAVKVAKRAPRMQATADILFWFEEELRRLDVELRLDSYLEAADVLAEKPDAVIVATGSLARMDGVQIANPGEPVRGYRLSHVLSVTDLLTVPARELGKAALVLDDTGGFEATAAAEFLAGKGLAVTYVTRHPAFAPQVQHSQRTIPILEEMLYETDFTLYTTHLLVEIREAECDIRAIHGTRIRTVRADTVVLVTPNEPLRGLYDQLRPHCADIHLIGDALSPRDMQAAIADGRQAAFAIAS